MVGNDIVDIAKAKEDSNWQRPRFLDKLFTSQEQKSILNSENPFLSVWKMWSKKEAAYKLYTQLNPGRFYNPKGFECKIEGKQSLVRFKDFECYVETIITPDYIVSEARLEIKSMTSIVIKLKCIEPKLQSKIVREAAIKFINKADKKARVVVSKFNIPILEIDSEAIPISLTHHGKFGAFAIA